MPSTLWKPDVLSLLLKRNPVQDSQTSQQEGGRGPNRFEAATAKEQILQSTPRRCDGGVDPGRPGSNLGIKRAPFLGLIMGIIREPQPLKKEKKGLLLILGSVGASKVSLRTFNPGEL